MNVIEELKLCENAKKNRGGGGPGRGEGRWNAKKKTRGGGPGRVGGQGGCGCENSKNKSGGVRGFGSGDGFFGGGEGGCERRSEVILKIKKQIWGWRGVGDGREVPVGGVRVDVNEELKLL